MFFMFNGGSFMASVGTLLDGAKETVRGCAIKGRRRTFSGIGPRAKETRCLLQFGAALPRNQDPPVIAIDVQMRGHQRHRDHLLLEALKHFRPDLKTDGETVLPPGIDIDEVIQAGLPVQQKGMSALAELFD